MSGDPHGECAAEIARLYGAAENCWLYAARHRKEAWAAPILEFCRAAGLGSPLRSERPIATEASTNLSPGAKEAK